MGRGGTFGDDKDAYKQLDNEAKLDGMWVREFGEENSSKKYADGQLDKQVGFDGIWVWGLKTEE